MRALKPQLRCEHPSPLTSGWATVPVLPVARLCSDTTALRRGSVLLLVLVVVMVLSFSAYTFSELAIYDYQASVHINRQIQTHELARSGIDAAAEALEAKGQYPSVTNFAGVVVATTGSRVSRFSILPEFPNDQSDVSFGLRDESSFLNVNSLPLENSKRVESRGRLTEIPGITNEIADAILDWMDADDEPSQFGAESSWYLTREKPYFPRQNRFRHLEELLAVRGVTEALFRGEDRNGNGIRDPGEVDVDADGQLQQGLQGFLTVVAGERTVARNGHPKINVNASNLVELYDVLASEFNQEIAQFVTAWRMEGPIATGDVLDQPLFDPVARRLERIESSQRRLRQQLEGADSELGRDIGSRGGFILSSSPPYQVRALAELIGVTVRITVNEKDTLLQSPWKSDANGFGFGLEQLESRLTISDAQSVPGRINIIQASLEVLRTVPGITPSLAQAIVSARSRFAAGRSRRRNDPTIAWLLEDGLVTDAQLRRLAPYITTGGDVHRGVSIGHIDGLDYASAVRFQLDGTRSPVQLTEMKHLPPLPVHHFPTLFPDNHQTRR